MSVVHYFTPIIHCTAQDSPRTGKKRSLPSAIPDLRHTTDSGTEWVTPGVVSSILHEGATFKLTSQVKVDHVEYLTQIPHFWPVPRSMTAYILDL